MIGHMADADAGVDVFLQIRASVSLARDRIRCEVNVEVSLP